MTIMVRVFVHIRQNQVANHGVPADSPSWWQIILTCSYLTTMHKIILSVGVQDASRHSKPIILSINRFHLQPAVRGVGFPCRLFLYEPNVQSPKHPITVVFKCQIWHLLLVFPRPIRLTPMLSSDYIYICFSYGKNVKGCGRFVFFNLSPQTNLIKLLTF